MFLSLQYRGLRKNSYNVQNDNGSGNNPWSRSMLLILSYLSSLSKVTNIQQLRLSCLRRIDMFIIAYDYLVVFTLDEWLAR